MEHDDFTKIKSALPIKANATERLAILLDKLSQLSNARIATSPEAASKYTLSLCKKIERREERQTFILRAYNLFGPHLDDANQINYLNSLIECSDKSAIEHLLAVATRSDQPCSNLAFNTVLDMVGTNGAHATAILRCLQSNDRLYLLHPDYSHQLEQQTMFFVSGKTATPPEKFKAVAHMWHTIYAAYDAEDVPSSLSIKALSRHFKAISCPYTKLQLALHYAETRPFGLVQEKDPVLRYLEENTEQLPTLFEQATAIVHLVRTYNDEDSPYIAIPKKTGLLVRLNSIFNELSTDKERQLLCDLTQAYLSHNEILHLKPASALKP